MLRTSLSLAGLLLMAVAVSARPGASRNVPGQAQVSFQFDIREDTAGNPRGKIMLAIGERKVVILPKATSQFRTLETSDYKSHDVPAAAIAACSGWWAGKGEDLYVLRRKKDLVVMIRYLDEGSARKPAYKRLKIIPMR
jgi:hypothetical protein